jgi:glycosyltransferase involved in cell wall biosynthesis
MILDIVLRTHSTGNLHVGQRFATQSKEELILKCVTSLINSVNLVTGHDIRITVFDDFSSESCIQGLKRIFATSKYPVSFNQIPIRGHGGSLHACYEFGRTQARDVIYFVEDDYLHYPSAITELIETYEQFKNNLRGREVSLLVNDDPDSYRPQWIEQCRIVLGKYRHWRTNLFSTSTFMISKKTLIDRWDMFSLHIHYGETPDNIESNTIDRVWRESSTLFSPIPTLAIHMQFTDNIAPFTDWKALWDSIVVP